MCHVPHRAAGGLALTTQVFRETKPHLVPTLVSGFSLMEPLLAGRALVSCRWSGILSTCHIHLSVLILLSLNKVFEVGGGDVGMKNDLNFISENRYT